MSKKPLRIIIAGSRGFENYDLLCKTMDRLTAKLKKRFIVLSGHAKGADRLGERYCFERLISYEVFHADWNKYGKAAGHRRNADMIATADAAVVFWDGASPGSRGLIEMAKKKGIKLRVITFKEKE